MTDAIADPIETHIDGLRFFRTDCAVGETNVAFVVTKNGSRGLGVPEVGEDVALVNAKLGVGVGGGILNLGDCTY